MTRPVIIGAGVAGLSCALAMVPRPVVVLGRKSTAELTSSVLAQGGIAAALGANDTIQSHIQDTLAAGAGLCDESAAADIIAHAPEVVENLIALGVSFDRDKTGALQLGLEAAHARHRIVHAQGAATGAAVMQALQERVRLTPSIMMIEDAEVVDLHTDGGAIAGVIFRQGGLLREILTNQAVLATGSACALWRKTTVPGLSWGHGLALAARAGAILRDLEFVQFHPTALDVDMDPLPLLSEALRGEGAVLVTTDGTRFVDELAPRDIVARAIWRENQDGRSVFLDARKLSDFSGKFPAIAQKCLAAGIDPATTPLPVCAAAHYHMGGIATDTQGRTNVPGLWACGEGACTGLHGANRLASNSLFEAFLLGARIGRKLGSGGGRIVFRAVPDLPFTADADTDSTVRKIMEQRLGLMRDAGGIQEAVEELTSLAPLSEKAFVGLMVAHAALARAESRGGHARADFPVPDPAQARPLFVAARGLDITVGEQHETRLFARHHDRNVGARRTA